MQNSIIWDDPLIKKYNVSGPRYTSYPTALSFEDGFTQEQVVHAVSESDNNKLSLYIHIPFCHQLCYYCGCNKIITRHQDKADLYLDYLEKEIAIQAQLFQDYQVEQLHLGGGTPTFLTKKQMTRLMHMVKLRFNFMENSEIGIEIDPRSLADGMLKELKSLGFNRVSFGIQDFNDDVQKAVNREQNADEVANLIKEARTLGYQSINTDMIYGLPLQTPESFQQTIERLITLSPDRISVFNYAHIPELFAAQRKIKDNELPSAANKLLMFKNTLNQLQQAGYVLIGMDHFAKKSDSLTIAQQNQELHRNFQGYTTHGNCDLLGLGVSSISQIDRSIYQNAKDLKTYYKMLDETGITVSKGLILNQDDVIRAYVIRQLICHFELDLNKVSQKFNIEFNSYFSESIAALEALVKDNMLNIYQDSIQVTAKGRLFIRIICMHFDAYLEKQVKLRRFSRVL